jgi:ABC-type antimicrobial peptide transport system permease subunit
LRLVSEGFFSTVGVRIVAGRPFEHTDTAQSPAVAIVNEAFARRSLSGSDPLRERIRGLKGKVVNGKFVPEEVSIVGVAANVKYSTLAADAEPVVYVPAAQFTSNPRTSIVVTTADGRPELHAAQFEAAVHALDPRIATSVTSLPAVVSRSLDRQRLGMWLMTGFGVAALLLAMVGIFGVVAYAVAQREAEMAIRQTLGATRSRVFWMVVLDSGRLALAGLTAGGVLAWWTGRLVGRYVFDVSAADPAILSGSAALVALVAALATAGPAMRASTKEFARALQQK